MKYNYTSESINWGTPKHIKDKYLDYFDPCPYPKPEWNGLEIEWKDKNFVNPPFKDCKKWAKKCMDEYKRGKEVILLIPVRTSSKYFHEMILPFARLEFLQGKIRFINLDDSADISNNSGFKDPIMLCHFTPSEISTDRVSV